LLRFIFYYLLVFKKIHPQAILATDGTTVADIVLVGTIAPRRPKSTPQPEKGASMQVLLIMIAAFIGYIVMYQLYGRYIGRTIFRLSAEAVPPSKAMEDGVDYVPTKKEVIFSHHFTSIAGTGPIVGPAIAVIWAGCRHCSGCSSAVW
jgi:hypothetical protein